jgi:putative transposase
LEEGMPRRARVFVEGLIYHVYNRVGRGEAPFKLSEEAVTFWSLLREVKRRDGLTVYAWCVMPNHYHLMGARADDSCDLWGNTAARIEGRYHRGRYHAKNG